VHVASPQQRGGFRAFRHELRHLQVPQRRFGPYRTNHHHAAPEGGFYCFPEGLTMKLKALIAGIAGTVMMATAASAADIQVIVPAAPPVVVVPVAPSFDWAGLYVGAYVAGPLEGYEVGGQAGFNFVRGNLLFGAAAQVGAIGFQAITIGGTARAGLLLGQTDRILVYAAAGAKFIPAATATLFTAVGGVEIGIGERLSVFGEAGVAVLGGPFPTFRAGINFHL